MVADALRIIDNYIKVKPFDPSACGSVMSLVASPIVRVHVLCLLPFVMEILAESSV